jgi:hypothetical protein
LDAFSLREPESTSLENAVAKFRAWSLQLLSTFARCLREPVEFRLTGAATNRTTNMGYRRGGFVLTPPSLMIFVIALILALFAMVVHYTHVAIPMVSASRAFDALAIAYVVLTIGVLFRGI